MQVQPQQVCVGKTGFDSSETNTVHRAIYNSSNTIKAWNI